MIAHALPFSVSFLFVPAVLAGALLGGWWIALVPALGYLGTSVADALLGRSAAGLDPALPEHRLRWHRRLVLAWVPAQLLLLAACLAAAAAPGHLSTGESVALFAALGIVTGGIGINYAHELVHQRNRLERRAGRLLLATVLYGHFETSHLHVHHVHVGTPRDPVTARYNMGFFRFLLRVLPGCLAGAWAVERARLARRGRPVWHASNPFWQYAGGAAACLALAGAVAGWAGVGLWCLQAFVAVYHLELVNYVEHYGLTRKHLGGGRFEPVQPRHSWNAAQAGSNWLLINLQRHSDHHWKPERRFPLLQDRGEEEAPQLPFGYPLMCVIAQFPPLWRRMMNPRVRRWRRTFYPEVTDWAPYARGLHEAAA